MKIRNLIASSLFLIVSLACKENTSYAKSNEIDVKKHDTLARESIATQKDIYINKEFFSGDELNDVEAFKTEKTAIDSVSYSIYKVRKTNNYIFSLEKFLKNDDVEKYKIADTANLKSADIDINIENINGGKILYLKSDQKVLKKWVFKNRISEKAIQWFGHYTGKFLRMKEESGDPRGWGTIDIHINDNMGEFQLNSYVENIKKDLVIVKKTQNEIVLSDKESKNNIFTILKNDNGFVLTSNFINRLVGDSDSYKLEKSP